MMTTTTFETTLAEPRRGVAVWLDRLASVLKAAVRQAATV